jgi:pimeloyl-ACP methyl ester carboxylesterase
LIGILDVPDGSERPGGTGVVLLNIGLHYRVCHNRLFVKLARALSREGYQVLRFDTHGVGDSEGEIEPGSVLPHFDSIQGGLFVSDTLAALDHFRHVSGLEKFVLAGLCGGALTAVHTAAVDSRVVGVIFIAGPMTSTSPNEEEELHPWEAGQWLNGYRQRFVNPRAWIRLFSGRSNYGMIARALAVKMRSRREVIRARLARNTVNNGVGRGFNWRYLESFQTFMGRDGRILFVFPELDKTAGEFETLFHRPILLESRELDGKYEVLKIRHANHSFTLVDSQERLREGIVKWLNRTSRDQSRFVSSTGTAES